MTTETKLRGGLVLTILILLFVKRIFYIEKYEKLQKKLNKIFYVE